MPESRTRKTYEAQSANAAMSGAGAELSFVTRDGEDLIIRMDREMLAVLQHQLAHALAPSGASSEQP